MNNIINILHEPKSNQAMSQGLHNLFPSGIKRILFIQPPDIDAEGFNADLAIRKRYWNYPPYGLMILSAIARKQGCIARILNMQNSMLKETISIGGDKFDKTFWDDHVRQTLRNEIEEFKPDLIGLTCMFSLTHQSMLDCISIIRGEFNVPIALGGVHVSNSFTDLNTKTKFLMDVEGVDLIFEREADHSLEQLIKFCNTKEDECMPGGIALINSAYPKGYLKINSPQMPSEDMLNIIPAFDLASPRELSSFGRVGTFESLLDRDISIATALFNRGCRAECTFCSVRNFNGRGVRGKSVDTMIEELKILRYEHDIRHIMWLDDDLLYNRKNSVELFNRMTKENLGMTWDTTNGVIAASCSEEVISAASDSGCIGMILGMESGNEAILKRIKKPGNVRHFLQAAEVLRKYPKINTRVFIMLGFPGETYGQLMDTFNVATQMNLDWSNINILQPLPNTPIFDEMVNLGILDPKEMNFNEISFSLGASGKLSGRRSGNKDMLADKFDSVFSEHGKDEIPTRQELDDIWAYMNFHLNFKKLEYVEDLNKLKIQYKWLTSICDNLAPRNGFAKYYLCVLENKLNGNISSKRIEQLRELINKESYWNNRLAEFNLCMNSILGKI